MEKSKSKFDKINRNDNCDYPDEAVANKEVAIGSTYSHVFKQRHSGKHGIGKGGLWTEYRAWDPVCGTLRRLCSAVEVR